MTFTCPKCKEKSNRIQNRYKAIVSAEFDLKDMANDDTTDQIEPEGNEEYYCLSCERKITDKELTNLGIYPI
jgi:ribosomal protein L37AE/L43A